MTVDSPWLEQANLRFEELSRRFNTGLMALSEPTRLRRIRVGLCALAAVWMVFGLANLVWSLVPPPEAGPVPDDIINPLVEPSRGGSPQAVAIEQLAGWALFGTAATTPAPLVVEEELLGVGTAAPDDLDGIENNAKETRLALTLQGVLNSSDPEQALAIIEAKKEQAQYLVGDEMPVGNKVTLAKILPDRVVLDNGGKYELLLLFDDGAFSAGGKSARRSTGSTSTGSATRGPSADNGGAKPGGNENVTEMAQSYRRRLYENPQSLAQVVKIAAVRDGADLKGYRVSAGRDRDQFEALGFQANDVVTGVNGIELTDPGKAVELYRVMRTANEASFDVLRNGEAVTLTVDLGNADAEQAGGDSGAAQLRRSPPRASDFD